MTACAPCGCWSSPVASRALLLEPDAACLSRNAQPPGPGLLEQAPSVKSSTVGRFASEFFLAWRASVAPTNTPDVRVRYNPTFDAAMPISASRDALTPDTIAHSVVAVRRFEVRSLPSIGDPRADAHPGRSS